MIAVEAERHNADVARLNVAANSAAVTVLHAAIWDEPGSVPFVNGLNGRVASEPSGEKRGTGCAVTMTRSSRRGLRCVMS